MDIVAWIALCNGVSISKVLLMSVRFCESDDDFIAVTYDIGDGQGMVNGSIEVSKVQGQTFLREA
ncbi:hypothetical protein NVP1015O_53 [Vibrio phage 1.015.O._10N.222.51.E5]|nr:hypothetical protein NVP1015O_53 [Vibrio phage 1.015.O._10N.222.51.E5]AUR83416.1 hypothetical protein NVP1034O_53 [Vibrio phage 1.034.O._10N.261.46.B7]AUR83484.1 hypothetical protein NVP1034X_54 [Vibrio phage 1.034.X._10N.261.46.B7]AUR90222.1 hypothetical protein NVP1139A_54 [Vibrio phage 1.139.A._10N.261.48.C6]AUR90289.1 hypothetical protein NVP1139B_54 [Vibrio phage 1.139.B._10N.261.48.C6]AUR95610.1 hypothetical protein NVP1209O_53 [Vibrio phage 1.209.O._10N.222.52.B2]